MSFRQQTFGITGVAGFIGSNLLETLLASGHRVVGLDNFYTGAKRNIELALAALTPEQRKNFTFIEGDIRNPEDCAALCHGVSAVLHQAALGSVPISIENPALTNAVNVDGFVNMLIAARNAGVERFVYASSSAVYGDEPTLPKKEDMLCGFLSPYAASKRINEVYAEAFARAYSFHSIGLRYFNVFGPRQDPNGAYAAVIPQWIYSLLNEKPVHINGDGENSRDFCFVEDCVQANLCAIGADFGTAWNRVYNIACGQSTTLNALFVILQQECAAFKPSAVPAEPVYGDFRFGDIKHSVADISLAREFLGFQPEYNVTAGLKKAFAWYARALNGA